MTIELFHKGVRERLMQFLLVGETENSLNRFIAERKKNPRDFSPDISNEDIAAAKRLIVTSAVTDLIKNIELLALIS